MKDILGGKGANLAEMTKLGVPVPPGFTLATDVCAAFYKNNRKYPAAVNVQVKENLVKLEKLLKAKLGDDKAPLLVSVRSGAAVSMPGMMDTVLNLGMNDKAVVGLSNITQNEKFAWDAYRRFIQMFSNVALGMDLDVFEDILEAARKSAKVEQDNELSAEDLKKSG